MSFNSILMAIISGVCVVRLSSSIGAAFVLPEYRYLMAGVQYADSFDVNLHKWLLVNFDCSALWVKNATHLVDAFNVDRVYLKHSYQSQDPQVPDYRVMTINVVYNINIGKK